MALKKISKAEALALRKKNPKARVFANSELQNYKPQAEVMGETPKAPKGLLENLALGLTKPLRMLGGAAETSIRNAAGGYKSSIADDARKSLLMTDEESEAYINKPALEAAKGIAGTASYVVPGAGVFGGGVKGAMASGGISGILGGFGTSSKQDVSGILKDTAKGAAMGAGTGGALGLLGNMFSKGGVKGVGTTSKIADTGSDLQQSALGIKDKLSPTGVQQADDLTEELIRVTSEKGQNPFGKGIGKTYDSLVGDLEKTIKGYGKGIDINPVFDDFSTKLADEGLDVTADASARKVQERLIGKLTKEGDLATAEGLSNLKRELQSELSSVYKKMDANVPLTDVEKTRLAFHDAIDSAIKTQIPGADNIYANLSILHQAAPDVIRKSASAGYVSFPLLMHGVGLPTFNLGQKAQFAIGGMLKKAGNINESGMLSKIGQGLPKTSKFATNAITNMVNNPVEGEEMPIEGTMIEEAPIEDQSIAVAKQLLDSGMKPNDVKTTLELLGFSGASSNTKLTKDQANAQDGLASLATIQGELERDPSALYKAALPGAPGARILDTAITSAADVIARLRTGAAISENEEKLFKSYLPKPLDSQDTIAWKLNKLNTLFSNIATNGGGSIEQMLEI